MKKKVSFHLIICQIDCATFNPCKNQGICVTGAPSFTCPNTRWGGYDCSVEGTAPLILNLIFNDFLVFWILSYTLKY